ncbi:ParB/RepB/Spo0J family partition protein [Streptomyces sp. NPDC090131]|uniref:ParB/RepB/Spo0J family partition protein n=1 Tax=Streptomyces sp. NPDC090131 TaxID=3365954 RepID=UPI003808A3F8
MAKHDQFDDFFGDDDDTPVIDTRADGRLLRVPLGRLSSNLVNPRTDFGTEAELIDLGKSLKRRQIQACPAVSRSAYLKLWPDHAKQIGDVDYVIVAGERRYRGAALAGNPSLNCVIDDGLAADRKLFMEAVVSENVDRQNFNPIEEAYAVQALVSEYGSNRAVAQRFERVDGWVTQRILLTHLARDVQDLVRKKMMPLDAARELGKLARDNEWDSKQQHAWWQSEQQRRAAASADRAAAKKAAKKAATKAPATKAIEKAGDSKESPDSRREPDGEARTEGADESATPQSNPSAMPEQRLSPEAVPKPDAETAGDPAPVQTQDLCPVENPSSNTDGEAEDEPFLVDILKIPRMPWHDGNEVAALVFEKMEDEQQRLVLLERLFESLNDQVRTTVLGRLLAIPSTN